MPPTSAMHPPLVDQERRGLMEASRMSAKQYAKFEKLFFLYGSTAKMVSRMITPVKPEEWQVIAEQVWEWTKEKVSSIVEEYTDGFLEPPPEMGTPAPESPDGLALQDAKALKQKYITVKNVELLRSG